jgi:hypothetical protein
MNRQYTYYKGLQRVAVVLVVGFTLAALLYRLDGEAEGGCNPLNGAAWFVLQMLGPVLLAGCQSVRSYIFDNSRLLQHLPDLVGSIGPLLCAIGGRAW